MKPMQKKDNKPSLMQCMEMIKKKKMFHNEVPEEYKENIEIIRVEVSSGLRTFERRGFDIVRNHFFVFQTVKEKTRGERVIEKSNKVVFESFSEYYAYLDGDIYTSACYFQYVFSKEDIEKYQVDLSKIKYRAFEEETLLSVLAKSQKEALDQRRAVERNRPILIEWRDKFCQCTGYEELVQLSKKYEKSVNCQF